MLPRGPVERQNHVIPRLSRYEHINLTGVFIFSEGNKLTKVNRLANVRKNTLGRATCQGYGFQGEINFIGTFSQFQNLANVDRFWEAPLILLENAFHMSYSETKL